MARELVRKILREKSSKEVREILDCDDEISLEITNLIREESSDFTDYLNFFEFVGFLHHSRQLNFDEIEKLFGYYLNCLDRRKDIRDYLERKDYGLLNSLLKEFAEKRK